MFYDSYKSNITLQRWKFLARAVVRERRIPFEIIAPQKKLTRSDGLQAFGNLRSEAKQNGIQDLSLDEINEEIRQARYGENK